VRIGIATGIVVIGDMVGEGSARERSIAGDTPNLAARLQARAASNEILVGLRTYQLLGSRFEYEGLGERMLKGFAAPVPVWSEDTSQQTLSSPLDAVGPRRGAGTRQLNQSEDLEVGSGPGVAAPVPALPGRCK
jgi:class 3 adenylate cyclase